MRHAARTDANNVVSRRNFNKSGVADGESASDIVRPDATQNGVVGVDSCDAHCEPQRVCTYFIHCPATNRVKIGRAKNPHSRFRDLSCAASSPLVLLGFVEGDIEWKLHRLFAGDRVQLEWFKISPALAEYVKAITSVELTPDADSIRKPDIHQIALRRLKDIGTFDAMVWTEPVLTDKLAHSDYPTDPSERWNFHYIGLELCNRLAHVGKYVRKFCDRRDCDECYRLVGEVVTLGSFAIAVDGSEVYPIFRWPGEEQARRIVEQCMQVFDLLTGIDLVFVPIFLHEDGTIYSAGDMLEDLSIGVTPPASFTRWITEAEIKARKASRETPSLPSPTKAGPR